VRRLIQALGLTAILVLAGAWFAAAALGSPQLPDSLGPTTGDLQTKPYEIDLSPTGGLVLAGIGRQGHHPHFGRLHWSRWNDSEGLARGGEWQITCKPNCASGSYHYHRVTLKAYRARYLSGYFVFTRLRIHFTRSKPAGLGRTQTLKVVYAQSGFEYR
jgi:hypothetical protein